MSVQHLVRLAAAAILAAAAGLTLTPAPASAATCSSASGVSVVVDFSALGGSVAATCVSGGGGDSAGSLFEVDHDLTRVAQFPGAVCKVDGAPGDAQCQRMPPTDAYWGLFWSDGSGGWVYSSEGVDSLTIPDGGSVAFAWQDGGSREQPGVAPPQHSAEEPSSSPTPDGGQDEQDGPGGGQQGDDAAPGPTGQPASPSSPTAPASTAASATPDQEAAGEAAGPDAKRDRDRKAKRRSDRQDRDQDGPGHAATSAATPEDDPSDAVPPSADPPSEDEGGLPTWVAPTSVAGLFAVAGVVALVRRRSAA